MLAIEKIEVQADGWTIDLRLAKCIEDGRDRTSEQEGSLVRGRGRRETGVLWLALGEPGGPRPAGLTDDHRFERKG